MTPRHSVRYDTKLTAEVILTVAPRQVQADATAGARHEHNPGLLATLEDPDGRLAHECFDRRSGGVRGELRQH